MNYHRKKHTTAKVMSVLLSVALLLSCMLPSTAWAAETGAYPNNWIVDWEATDGITIDEWVIDPEGFDDESYEDYEYEYDWDTPELYDDEAYAGDGIFPAFAPLDESARVVHEIRTAAEMASFLRGGIGGNDDHYIVMNNITMGTAGGDIFSGRGLDAEGRPFTGIFEGYSGLANPPVITGLRLRPGLLPMAGNTLHNNNVGLIRVAADGATIRNITLHHAGSTGNLAAQITASGFATDATHHFGAEQGRAGMFVGRVLRGNVTIENVRLTGHTIMVSASTPARSTNLRMGGFVGQVNAGASLTIRNISSNNVDLNSSTGRIHSVGGVIGSTSGTVNMTHTSGRNEIRTQTRGGGRENTVDMPARAGGVIGFMEAGHVVIENTNTLRNNMDAARQYIRTTLFGGGFVGTTGTSGSLTIRNARNEINLSVGHVENLRLGGIIGRTGVTTVLNNVENAGRVSHLNAADEGVAGTPRGQNMGGLIGRTDGITTITNARNESTGVVRSMQAGTSSRRAAAMGGIVGFAQNRITITNTHNQANVLRSMSVSGNNVGGIVGHIHHGGSAGNRRAELRNVTNSGIIGNTAGVRPANAGGIVGHIRDRASAVNIIDNAVNSGRVDATTNAGGIIGHANSRNTTITRAMNYGNIASTATGARRSGGIVGLSNRAGMVIRDSANLGTITGAGTGNGTAGAAGHGGIVGSSTGGGFRVETSFNAGFINTAQFNTGGILGNNRAAATLLNVYNVGTVNTSATRGGAGILGRRSAGSVVIQNAFVGGNFSGSAVAVSGTAVGRPVTGLTFRNVYVDRSVSRTPADNAILQNNRGGINAVTTEQLTAGFLTGITGGPWLIGMPYTPVLLDPGTDTWSENPRRTYPFFAWQTGGTLQEQFFQEITPHIDMPSPAVAAQRTAQFNGVNRALVYRVFNPYVIGPHPALPAGVTPSITHTRAAGLPVSIGLISTDYVVSFSVGEVPDRIEVRAIDAEIYRETGNKHFIEWAQLDSDTPDSQNINGVYLMLHMHAAAGVTEVTATATGYYTNTITLTADEISERRAYIHLERQEIEVAVFVRHPQTDANLNTDPVQLGAVNHTDSWVEYPYGTDITRNAPIPTPESAWFPLNGALVREYVYASAPGHALETAEINPLDFRRNADGSYALTADGRFIMDIHLTDIRLANFEVVPVEYNADRSVRTTIPFAPLIFNMEDPSQSVNPTYTRTAAAPNRFNVVGATEETEIWIEDTAGNFATSDVITVAADDLFGDPEDLANYPAGRIFIEMNRIGDTRDLRVVESIALYNGDQFVMNFYRPIPDADVLIGGSDIRVTPRPGFPGEFTVRIAIDEVITATASGFEDAEYLVKYPNEGEIVIMMERTLPPVGVISGYVLAVEDLDTGSQAIGVGQPVAGARVEIRNSAGFVVATVFTDANGFYSTQDFALLAPGIYDVSASLSGFLPTQSHHNPVELTENAGAIADVFKTWTESFNLEVSVTGPTGDARSGISVMLNGEDLTMEDVDAVDGPFWRLHESREILTGPIIAWANGFRPARFDLQEMDNDRTTGWAIVDIALTPIVIPPDTGIIHGIVRDVQTGLPVADAAVVIRNTAGAVVYETTTDENGYYESAPLAVAGDHFVTVTADGYMPGLPANTPTAVVLDQATTANVYLEQGADEYKLIVHLVGGSATSVMLRSGSLSVDATEDFDLEWLETVWGERFAIRMAGDLHVNAPGFAVPETQVTIEDYINGVAIVVIVLEEVTIEPDTGTLFGYVYHATTGQPIVGAAVTAVGPNDTVRHAITNAHGFYQITGLPAGSYVVMASADGFRAGFSYESPATIQINAAARGNVALFPDTTGDERYMMVATVSGATTGIEVMLNDSSNPFTHNTANNVWFHHVAAPLDGTVYGITANHYPASAGVEENDFDPSGIAHVHLHLEEIGTPPGPGILRGFVRASATRTPPIPGANVTAIHQATGETFRTTTDQFGFYIFDAGTLVYNGDPLFGYYTVIADAPGFNTGMAETVPVLVSAVAGAGVNVYLTAGNNRYMLAVTVVGGPANRSMITVELDRDYPHTATMEMLLYPGSNIWSQTDPAMLLGLVRASASGYIPDYGIVTEAHYDAGNTAVVTLTIQLIITGENHGVVSGYVRNADDANSPVSGATVTMMAEDGSIRTALTNAAGFYIFINVAPGPHSVFATATGFDAGTYVNNPVTATAGGVLSDIDIFLTEGADGYLLLVAVETPPGAPFVGTADVMVVDGTPLTRVNNDSNIWMLTSSASLTGDDVKASAYRHHSDRREIGTPVNRVKNITLTLTPFAESATGIFGRVTRADDGTAIVGATILIQDASGNVVRETTTDAFGDYVATGLTPDTYTVTVIAAGYVSQSRSVTTIENEMLEENFALVAGTPANYVLIATVHGATSDTDVVIVDGATLTRIAGTNLWEIQGNASFTGDVVRASAPNHVPATATVGNHSAAGFARVTLTLVERELHTVIFDMNGATSAQIPSVEVLDGDLVDEPTEPTRTYHDFAGWFTVDGEVFYFDTPITESLILVAHWTREMHTVVFDMNGATSAQIPAAEVLHGNQVARPADNPTRTNHVFVNWYTVDGDVYEFDTPVTSGLVLVAHWTREMHTVIFDMNGATSAQAPSAEVLHGNQVTRPADPTRTNYNFVNWYTAEGALYDFAAPVTESMILVAHWTRELHTVVFDMNGATSAQIPSAEVLHGDLVTRPTEPTRTYHTFAGWYTVDGDVYEFDTPVISGLVLVAHWTREMHTVVFDMNGATSAQIPSAEVLHGERVAEPIDPTRTYHTFAGWHTVDGIEYDFNTPVTSGLVLIAHWTREQHMVIFDMNGATSAQIPAAEVLHGDLVARPADNPTRTNYTFINWFTVEGDVYEFDTPVTSGLVLVAHWTREMHTVIFDMNGATSAQIPSVEVLHGDLVTRPTEPTRTYHTFAGWFTVDGTAYNFETTPVTESMILVAHWTREMHTVIFDMNGATSAQIPSAEVLHGDLVTRPTEPTRTNHTFAGWHTVDGTVYNFETTPVTGSLILVAHWTREMHTVIFDMNGATSAQIPSAEVLHGDLVARPTDPTRTNYNFVNWYTVDGAVYDFGADVTGGLVLVAHWTREQHMVIFDMNGATSAQIPSVEVLHGELVTRPTDPTRTNHTFAGWHTVDGTAYNFETTPVTGSMILVAHWTREMHTVIFDMNGATSAQIPSAEVLHGDTVARPADNPTRTNYTFVNWFTVEGDVYEFDTPVTSGLVLVAHWTREMHTVIFDMNGATSAQIPSAEVLHGEQVTRPADNPTRTNYTFVNWFTVDGTEYNFNTPVTSGLVLVAHWTREQHMVIFDMNGATSAQIPAAEVLHGNQVARPTDNPTRTDHVFVNWFTVDGVEYDFTAPVTGSMILVAHWTREMHTVVFDMNGATSAQIPSAEVLHGDLVTRPTDPTRTDHNFVGWFTVEGVEYNFAAPVTGSMILVAHWTRDLHTVIFDMNGATSAQIPSAEVLHGELVTRPTDPTRTDHTFAGWYTVDGTAYNFETTPVTGSLILVAHWTREQHMVIFDMNGATSAQIPSAEVLHGELVARPTDPTRTNHTFAGWHTVDGTAYNFETTPVTESMILVAHWTREMHTVVFDMNGATSAQIPAAEVLHGNQVARPTDNPTRTNYTFVNWYTVDGDVYEFDTPVTSGLVLVAHWTREMHMVIFDMNGATSAQIPSAEVLHGEQVTRPTDPTRTNHTFAGWHTVNGEVFYFDTPITESMILVAHWTREMHTVIFDMNGATSAQIPSAEVLHGELVTRPTEPTRTYHTFAGWHTVDGAIYEFDTPVTSGLVLVAHWTREMHTVIFDMNGATSAQIPSAEVLHGNQVARPADNPTRTNYTFVNWFTVEGDVYEFDTPVTSGLVLVAHWTREQHMVIFDMNGATSAQIPSVEVLHGEQVARPADNPTRTNYTFVNWFTVEGVEYDFTTPVTSGLILVAHWTPEQPAATITITFDSVYAGALPQLQTAEVIPGTIYAPAFMQIVQPIRSGYEFVAWVNEAGNPINALSPLAADAQDHTLFAQWRMVTQDGFGNIWGFVTADAYIVSVVDAPASVYEYEYEDVYEYLYTYEYEYTYEYPYTYEYTYTYEYPYTYEFTYTYVDEFGYTQTITETRTEIRTGTRTEIRTEIRTGTRTETGTEIRTGTEIKTGIGFANQSEILSGYATRPVIGATVTVVPADGSPHLVATTNDDGFYSIMVPVGDYTVIVSKPGFVTAIHAGSPHTVGDGDEVEASFHLTEDHDGNHRYMLVVNIVGGPADRSQIDVTFNGSGLNPNGIVWSALGNSRMTGYVEVMATGYWTYPYGMRFIETGDYTNGVAVTTLWLYRKIAVSFDRNAGGGASDLHDGGYVRLGGDYFEALTSLPANWLSRNGFNFQGWWTAPTGGQQITASSIVENPADHTLFARWQPIGGNPGGTGGGGTTPPPTELPDTDIPLDPFVTDHISFIGGFPDGTVRPNQSITRAEVAQILFRLIDSDAKHSPQANRFSDVTATSWYAQAVNYLAGRGILSGYPDGTFRPNAGMSRAELTAVMSRFFALNDNGMSNFTDVNNGHWASRYINNAHSRGWITGYADGSFRPNNQVTRAETVTLINRVLDRIPNPITIDEHLQGMTVFIDLTHAHWAYYQIMEAAIEHEFMFDADGREVWTSIVLPR